MMHNDLEFYQLTTVGDRSINQDFMIYKVVNDYALFVVADGLGGHHAGEKASNYFCQGMYKQAPFFQKMLKDSGSDVEQIFIDWVAAAIVEMTHLFGEDEAAKNAHTTCVVLYLDKERAVTAHCGDSRIYRLNEESVVWRTKDHSLIQKQLDAGEISESEMGLHPEQNQLTRSINILKSGQAEVNIYPPIKTGETFLLCTDGFWEFIKEKDLLQLSAKNCGKDELKKIAKMMHLRAGGRGDNLTVQWVRCK